MMVGHDWLDSLHITGQILFPSAQLTYPHYRSHQPLFNLPHRQFSLWLHIGLRGRHMDRLLSHERALPSNTNCSVP